MLYIPKTPDIHFATAFHQIKEKHPTVVAVRPVGSTAFLGFETQEELESWRKEELIKESMKHENL